MKILKFLLAGVISLGLMACNNEEVPDMTGEKDATISIKVFPSSDGPTLRTVGDVSGNGILPAGLAAESTIKSLEVWVFTGNALEAYKSATIVDGAPTEVVDIKVTSGPRSIVVVANAGLGTQATLSGLKALTKDLTQDLASGLVMTAKPIENVLLVKGNNYYGYTDTEVEGKTATAGGDKTNLTPESEGSKKAVALTRVNARVAIVGATLTLATLPDGQVHVFDNLKDIQVAMFNVPKTTNLFGTPLAKNADYLFGSAWPSPLGTYTVGAAETSLLDTTVTFPIVNTAAPYYFVTENTSETASEQMFIVLRGKPHMGDTAVTQYQGLYTDVNGYTYYPIWVNGKDLGYDYGGTNVADGKVVRNTQYNITLTITGIGRPTIDEPETANLDVKVEVAPWLVVSQAVTW